MRSRSYSGGSVGFFRIRPGGEPRDAVDLPQKTTDQLVAMASKNEQLSIDSIYVRDSTFICDSGVVLCRMGKAERIVEAAEILKTISSKPV